VEALENFEICYKLNNFDLKSIHYISQTYLLIGNFSASIEFAQKGLSIKENDWKSLVILSEAFKV